MRHIIYTLALTLALLHSAYAEEKKYDDNQAGIHITYPSDWAGPIQLSRNTAFRSPDGLTLMIGSFPGDASLPENKRGLYDSILGGKSKKIEAPIKLKSSTKEISCVKTITSAGTGSGEIPDMYNCLAINRTHAYVLGFAGRPGLTSLSNPVFVNVIKSLLEIKP
jgi:hypothetical protein